MQPTDHIKLMICSRIPKPKFWNPIQKNNRGILELGGRTFLVSIQQKEEGTMFFFFKNKIWFRSNIILFIFLFKKIYNNFQCPKKYPLLSR